MTNASLHLLFYKDGNDPITIVFMLSLLQLALKMFIFVQLFRWFLWSADCAQVVYNYVWLRNRSPRKHLKVPAPDFGSDTISFLFYDVTALKDIITLKEDRILRSFHDILSAIKREQLAGGEVSGKPPWWDHLPWRILKAMKPDIGLLEVPSTIGTGRLINEGCMLLGSCPGSRTLGALAMMQSTVTCASVGRGKFQGVVYGDERWFGNPMADSTAPIVLQTWWSWMSGLIFSRTVVRQNNLDWIHQDLVQRLNALRSPPGETTLDSLNEYIETAWTGNAYLVDLGHRHEMVPWSVRFPVNIPVGMTVVHIFKPRFMFLLWVHAFQIAVDREARTAQIQMNVEEYRAPEPQNMAKFIGGFRILHAELLRALKKMNQGGCRSFDELGDTIEEIFMKAAETDIEKLSTLFSVEEHWKAVREWRPTCWRPLVIRGLAPSSFLREVEWPRPWARLVYGRAGNSTQV